MKLVSSDDPVLRMPTEKFDFANPPMNPLDLVSDMAQIMIDNKGIGLAANQVGLSYRVMVVLGEELIPMFNPKIVDASSESIMLEEGCLSFPGLLVKIKRPRRIRVMYTDPKGNTTIEAFDGIVARSIQHEIAHLDGIRHIDQASYIHREQALNKWKKLKKELDKA